MGGKRGRLIGEEERLCVLALIQEATLKGARRSQCCEILSLSLRTLQRWEKPDGARDRRILAVGKSIKSKLTSEEKKMMLETANTAKFRDLSPCKT